MILMNMFSMFDPSSFVMSTSWIVFTVILMLTQTKKMKKETKMNMVSQKISETIKKEMEEKQMKVMEGGTMMMVAMFIMMAAMNTVALAPFSFTMMAQMVVTFPMAGTLWAAINIYGWKNNTKKMMAHTVPSGTPLALMNFMVVIELVSAAIRPITLSVRLTANMVAGHLLMSLLSNFSLGSMLNISSGSVFMAILMALEMGVALIQSYVFVTLVSLYIMEVE